jgi:hypothetical protein
MVGKGMDPRDAREESADCMMCLVVTGWSDSMLRDMVARYKKVILPEQSQLDMVRRGAERTLFDQMVDLMLKHQKEFPLTILHQSRADGQPKVQYLSVLRIRIRDPVLFYPRDPGWSNGRIRIWDPG